MSNIMETTHTTLRRNMDYHRKHSQHTPEFKARVMARYNARKQRVRGNVATNETQK